MMKFCLSKILLTEIRLLPRVDIRISELFFLILSAFVFVSTFSRICLFLFSQPAIKILASLSFFQMLMLLFRSVVLDLLAVIFFILPFQLFLFYPFKKTVNVYLFACVEGIVFFVWLLFFKADYVFFKVFSRHIGMEIFSALENADYLLSVIFSDYLFFTVAAFVVSALSAYILCRILLYKCKNHNVDVEKRSTAENILITVLWPVCVLMMFCFHNAILNSVMYADSVSVYSGNPLFTVLGAAVHRNGKRKLYFSEEEGNVTAMNYLFSRNEEIINKQNYFLRKRNKFCFPEGARPNFVIFFLESFNPQPLLSDSPQVPEMNRLKTEGRYFPHFFSSGGRSRIGLNALLYSVPPVRGIPETGIVSGRHVFYPFADYFKKAGYKTLYVQTGQFSDGRKSAVYSGFENVFSAADIPGIEYKVKGRLNEEYGMNFFLEKADSIADNGPFLGIYYTAAPHYPYSQYFPEEETSDDETLYMRTLNYVDSCIAGFMKKAKKKQWFENTVFVFLPDHRGSLKSDFDRSRHSNRDNFLSFLILYSPKYITPGTDNAYTGQEDILPTLIDMSGYKGAYLSTGNSVLDNTVKRKSRYIFYENGTVCVLNDKGSYSVRAVAWLKPENHDSIEIQVREAAAFEERIYSAMYDGKWKLQ